MVLLTKIIFGWDECFLEQTIHHQREVVRVPRSSNLVCPPLEIRSRTLVCCGGRRLRTNRALSETTLAINLWFLRLTILGHGVKTSSIHHSDKVLGTLEIDKVFCRSLTFMRQTFVVYIAEHVGSGAKCRFSLTILASQWNLLTEVVLHLDLLKKKWY